MRAKSGAITPKSTFLATDGRGETRRHAPGPLDQVADRNVVPDARIRNLRRALAPSFPLPLLGNFGGDFVARVPQFLVEDVLLTLVQNIHRSAHGTHHAAADNALG